MIVDGYHLSMIRGDSEGLLLTMTDGKNQPLIFQNGDTLFFTVRFSVSSKQIVLQKIITEFEQHQATITLDPLDTQKLKFGTYVYDIQLTRENGGVRTIIPPSNLLIKGEVTYD